MFYENDPKERGNDESGDGDQGVDAAGVAEEKGDRAVHMDISISLVDSRPTLSDITLEVKPGELICVYGQTGCGKSSLLLSILGEVRRLQGSVQVCGMRPKWLIR